MSFPIWPRCFGLFREPRGICEVSLVQPVAPTAAKRVRGRVNGPQTHPNHRRRRAKKERGGGKKCRERRGREKKNKKNNPSPVGSMQGSSFFEPLRQPRLFNRLPAPDPDSTAAAPRWSTPESLRHGSASGFNACAAPHQ